MNQKILEIFERIRDEPLHNPESLKEKDNRCWGKHRRLKELFEKEGYKVKYRVYGFKWSKQRIPEELLSMQHDDEDCHLALEIKVYGDYLTVDASNDSELPDYNKWDGKSNCKIAVEYEKIYTYDESSEIEKKEREEFLNKLKKNKKFYKAVNKFLERVRRK